MTPSLPNGPCADWMVRSGWRVQESLATGGWMLRSPSRRVVARGDKEEMLAMARVKAPASGCERAVIVLHGLGRNRHSMRAPAAALARAGFAVADLTYSSLLRPIDAAAAQVATAAAALAEDGAREIHLVGHSLGGLVARLALANGLPVSGRLVTIGTPNNGAAIADRIASMLPAAAYDRSCLSAIVGGAVAVPPPSVPTAVVAGGNSGRGYNPLLDGDNDGIVTVAETRLTNEAAFILVRSIHTVLMDHPAAVAAVLAFLGEQNLPEVFHNVVP